MRTSDEILRDGTDVRAVLCELCRRFHALGWASGTGGGISIREGARVWVAPSGVHKELIAEDDLFAIDLEGTLVAPPRDPALRPSACTPLFLHAYRLRDAGAVIHSHSKSAMLATLLAGDTLRVSRLEMIKGLAGHGYRDEVVVPILENTDHEEQLADGLEAAIRAFPRTHAVLVRAHGVYVWGRDWRQAKAHAEVYDYLFDVYVRMRQLGVTR
ncbi:methylthioribulose 1-phosphate dehydratase [Sandaracinus amylolyticus]|uniref:methylthioribulose 1-phosphate dehydratase n=1 Tax=Sandaracinus amylolyticus TaxID=927083 RepID=UPI001EFFD53F|nr:methylthioribulose 1-phosphate dehydratase [Sandaracinus amylolyticus]UJR79422.1 Methylthioribulose-1-phosphate dehydratase [Sandaracinus amylolyticus]